MHTYLLPLRKIEKFEFFLLELLPITKEIYETITNIMVSIRTDSGCRLTTHIIHSLENKITYGCVSYKTKNLRIGFDTFFNDKPFRCSKYDK